MLCQVPPSPLGTALMTASDRRQRSPRGRRLRDRRVPGGWRRHGQGGAYGLLRAPGWIGPVFKSLGF